MKKFYAIFLAVLISGCASLENRYKSIIFDDGVNQSEAKTVAQYHIAQHPLNKEFKRKPNRIINDGGNVWQFYFNSRDQFDYVFRVDIERSSGKIVRSGLIPKEKSQFEKILTNFLMVFTQGDIVLVGLVVQFSEEHSRWPSNHEEMEAWIRNKSEDGSKEDKKDGLVDTLSQVEFLNATMKQVELHLPPPTNEIKYKEYFFDPKLFSKRKIIISKGDESDTFQIRYPELGNLAFPVHIKHKEKREREGDSPQIK